MTRNDVIPNDVIPENMTDYSVSPDDMVLTARGLRFQGRLYPCTIGRGGLSRTKREGDGATPVGIHHVVGMFYRADRMPRPAHWAEPTGLRDLWSDDSRAPEYNQLVRAPYAASHETMRRADPLYDLVMITDWNYPEAEPERGSCIFIHRWRRKGFPTAGCLGLRPDHLLQIAARIEPGARFVVPPIAPLLRE